MRVLCVNGKYAIEIKCAKLYGNQLIFTTLDNIQYYTDNYCHEKIAYMTLRDLVRDGYIYVEELYRR